MGGGQEFGFRSGTLNVPAIVGFGEAARLALSEIAEESKSVGSLRDRLFQNLKQTLPEVYLNGSLEHRVPHNLNLSFKYIDTGQLMRELPELAMSAGAACSSSKAPVSHVLTALGCTPAMARSAIRLTLGRFTTVEEIDYASEQLVSKVNAIRQKTVIWKLFNTSKKGKQLLTNLI